MTEPLKPRIDFTGQLEKEPLEHSGPRKHSAGLRPIILRLCCRKSRLLMKGKQKQSLNPRCALNVACGAKW